MTPARQLPLAGQRVLVPRPKDQEAELMALLREQGADPVHVPLIEIQPPSSFAALDEALWKLASYQWLLFSSANGVRSFLSRAEALGIPLDPALEGRIQVCAIGPATRDALLAAGLPVHLMPERYVAEGLAEAFANEPLAGTRVLLPRAAAARDVAPEALRAMGAEVDAVEAYRSGIPAESETQLRELRESGWQPDWVLFTSASTVKHFLAIGGHSMLEKACTVSIGPATTAAMQAQGLVPYLESADHSAQGVVNTMLQPFSS